MIGESLYQWRKSIDKLLDDYQAWKRPGNTGEVQWVRSPPRKGLASHRVARPWKATSNDRF